MATKTASPADKGGREPPGDAVVPVELRHALEERYLAYALSTIMNRALPDVRDGMKPVHRRILFAMRQMRLLPSGGHKKSAKVVGEVMGNFHPHGDQAIYDALVRLAQDFSVRYPLVDGQGNFGNVDGDNAAAMRYTEARLTSVATLLLDGIDEDAVDFRPTYDGEGSEPSVLPGAFPNLLANGSTGIAVGMATAIPPHNAAELCDAALMLIGEPDAEDERLLEHVKGPDLPTGGIIVSTPSEIAHAYRTGRGAFRVRARWHREDTGRGTWVVVVTEIPFQTPKSRLIEEIATLIEAKKLPLLADLRDESAEDVRVVLEPRSRSIDPLLLMESLFRSTGLESRFSLNMNVLSAGQVPRVMSLKETLAEWLGHRKDVLVRRSGFRLKRAEERLEILDGFLIAYLNLDAVIRVIREADDAKRELMTSFSLSDAQATAILDLRLRALRKLEELAIRKEHKALTKERDALLALLESSQKQWRAVAKEIAAVRETYGPDTPLGKRRTSFEVPPAIEAGDIAEAMVEREPVTIVLSEKGWVRALKGHGHDRAGLAFKEGDALALVAEAQTTDRALLFSTGGRVFTVEASKLPGGRGAGEPLRLMVDLPEDDRVFALAIAGRSPVWLLATARGFGLQVAESDLLATTRKGKQVLNLVSGDETAVAVPAEGDNVAVIGTEGTTGRRLLVFPLADVPRMARGKGVRLQRYRLGRLTDARVFAADTGLSWTDTAGRRHNRAIGDLADWIGLRGQTGRNAPTGFPRSNRFDG